MLWEDEVDVILTAVARVSAHELDATRMFEKTLGVRDGDDDLPPRVFEIVPETAFVPRRFQTSDGYHLQSELTRDTVPEIRN